jgi:alpha-ketoglutarate-dependent 2,4-dichlorophenoxyacetate dioxygenase
MKLAVTPIHPLFVANVTGVDLAKRISDAVRQAVEDAMDAYAVCALPGQHLNDEEQIAFSRLYGPLEVSLSIAGQPGDTRLKRRIAHREIFDISNLDAADGISSGNDARSAFMLGNQLWHTDSSFRKERAAWSMLHARVVPPAGGDTEFADTRAAYDALPEAIKQRLNGLVAEHSLWHSRAKLGGYVATEDERNALPSAGHPLVRRHPGSGRSALYIGSHVSHIVGMPIGEGQALLAELIAFATQPQFVYRHRWQVGDLVIWDNRCTMHRATPFEATDHVRDMRRTTIIDRAPEAVAR